MTSPSDRYDDGIPFPELIPPKRAIALPADRRAALVAAIALARWRRDGGDFDTIHDEEKFRHMV